MSDSRASQDAIFQNAKIDDIPFENESSREVLRKLDKDLGGLSIIYTASSESKDQHYLGLNIEAEGRDVYYGLAWHCAATPDKALRGILAGIEKLCAKDKLLLVVNDHSQKNKRRAFGVTGDSENGFAFRSLTSPTLGRFVPTLST